MLSYFVPVVFKKNKPIVVLKDNKDRSTKGRLQKQEQRTTMPMRFVPPNRTNLFFAYKDIQNNVDGAGRCHPLLLY